MTEPETLPTSLLEQRLEIETPERVAIVYDIAGIGSRFAAGTIDVVLIGVVFLVVAGFLVLAFSVTWPSGEEAVQAFMLGGFGVLSAVLLLYYAGFEWAWSGQTPGKRALKLRVISDTGAPATPAAVFLRNVLRIADALPCIAPFGLGGLVMFVNSRAKRIGDFAAGTIVVRERPEPLATPRRAEPDGLPGETFDATDVARAREFTRRAAELIQARRLEIASAIALDIAGRHGITVSDPAEFLRLVTQGFSPDELRDLGIKPQ